MLSLGGEARTLDPDGADRGYIPSLSIVWACYDYLVDFVLPKDFDDVQASGPRGSRATTDARRELGDLGGRHGLALQPSARAWCRVSVIP